MAFSLSCLSLLLASFYFHSLTPLSERSLYPFGPIFPVHGSEFKEYKPFILTKDWKITILPDDWFKEAPQTEFEENREYKGYWKGEYFSEPWKQSFQGRAAAGLFPIASHPLILPFIPHLKEKEKRKPGTVLERRRFSPTDFKGVNTYENEREGANLRDTVLWSLAPGGGPLISDQVKRFLLHSHLQTRWPARGAGPLVKQEAPHQEVGSHTV